MTTDLLFVTRDVIPHPTGNGNAVLCQALLDTFCKAGLSTETLIFRSHENAQSKIDDKQDATSSVRVVHEPKRNITRRMKGVLLGNDYFIDTETLRAELKKYDWSTLKFVCTYSWESLNVHSLVPDSVCSISSLVDLMELHRELRKLHGKQHDRLSWKNKMLSALRWRNQVSRFYAQLRNCDVILEHAFQHAEQLKGMGFGNVHYLPHPLPTQPELKRSKSDIVRVLIPGSLKGITSRLGFDFFFNELLIEFDRRRHEIRRPYRFRIVGHGELPGVYQDAIRSRADCDFGGFAKDMLKEYESSDIVLVNVPVPHGFRTRIAEAFSYGLCVIAHQANAEGMPELIDARNSLLSAKPEVLAQKLISAINDGDLRRKIGVAAKEDFESQLSMEIAAQKMRRILDLK
jgi:glycosyltransferase involved in cell wall biosynthesis